MTLPDWSPGHIVAGKYTVQSLLGRSDNSRTYAALTEPNLEVILRVFEHGVALERSLSEMTKVLTELEPYALRVIEVARDVASGAMFVAAERSRHPSLATLVELCPLTLKEGILFAESLGAALDAAHHKDLSHLALAPTNVFVGPAPECAASLADFGLPPPIPPTIAEGLWRAPEQLDLKGETTATDVFTAALLVFFALTGKPYWRATDDKALREEHGQPRVPASVRATEIGVILPYSIDAPFESALATAPAQRPKSAGEFARMLEAACKTELEYPSASEPALADLPKVIVEPPRPPKRSNDEPTLHLSRPPPPPDIVAPLRRGEPTLLMPRVSGLRRAWIAIGALGLFGVIVAGVVIGMKRSHKHDTTTIASAPIPSVSVPPPPASSTPPAASSEPPPLGPDEGEITVTCDPGPCDLVMVDAKKWETYPEPYRVKEGKHGVGISKAHYWGDWRLVTVKAGERHEVTFKLNPRPPGAATAKPTTTTTGRRPPRLPK